MAYSRSILKGFLNICKRLSLGNRCKYLTAEQQAMRTAVLATEVKLDDEDVISTFFAELDTNASLAQLLLP